MRKFLTLTLVLLLCISQAYSYGSRMTNFNTSINQFPFLEFIHVVQYTPVGILLAPTEVRWPMGAMQERGTFGCESMDPIVIDVEVFLSGVTDADPMAPGTNIACVVHLGRVGVFGTTPCDVTPVFQCVRNINMTYAGADNGLYDVFTATIMDLPPGNYEYTCACSDNGTITNPLTHPMTNIRWIGQEDCPLTNPFINGRFTVNEPAPNDECNIPTLVPLVNGNNPVDNLCTTDGGAGFIYTVTNGEVFNITATQGAGTLVNPSVLLVRLNDCAGVNLTLPLRCLPIGTQVLIQAGNSGACPEYGTFNINISDMDNGVANDLCLDATPLNNFGGNNELNCGETGNFTGTADACPDVEANACFGTTTNGVWYRFTTNTALSMFSITGTATYQLFSGTCASLTSHGCSITDFVPTPLTTYYLLVGPTGTATVTAAPLPANDICANAIPVSEGTTNNLTNECATTDFFSCGQLTEASVWYSFVVTAAHNEVVFEADLTNGIVRVFSACNLANLSPDADGNNCNAMHTLSCPAPGTYFVQVGSRFDQTDIFSLTVTATSNNVLNDDCVDATVLTIPNDCNYHPNTTNTTDACPETFSLPCNGGNNNADETVWVRFTPPAGVVSINVRNITPAGAYLSIFDNCNPTVTIPGGGCLTGAGPTPEILVTAGTTYYIAVAIAGGEGVVNFDIKYNEPPANDACANALTTLTGTHSNLCSTQDVVNNNCTTQDDASVWFSYTFPLSSTHEEIVVTITPTGSPAINNGLVAIYSGCGAASLLADDDGNNCNASATLKCPVPGTTYLIMVSSVLADAGEFTINVVTNDNGVANEICGEATLLDLTNGLCQTPPNNFAGTNVDACPESATLNFGGCTFEDGPGVWYSFITDANTTLLDISVTGLNTDIGLFTNCTGTSVAGGCGTNGMLMNVTVTGNTTYYLLVVGDAGAEGPFTINITEKRNPPANDLCANATVVNLGLNSNLSNNCATEDFTPCTAPQNEASVWYYYDYTGPGNELIFTVTATGGSDGITDPSIIVYDACNAGADLDDAEGILCNNVFEVNCPVPGTRYLVWISSSSNNAGQFSLNVQLNNTAPPNDNCVDATDIPQSPTCEFFTVQTTTTVNACPEVFTVGGCALNYAQNAVVWYEFTTPLGTTSIEVEDIAPGAYLSIHTVCPTPGNAIVLAGAGCLTGAGTNGTPINVNENTTYWVAIGIPNNTGDVFFDIKYNLEPDHDNPCVGGFIPVLLTSGSPQTNEDNTCATDDDDMCGGATYTNTLWYSFTVTAPNNSITINVTGTGANPINNPAIALYDNIGAGTPNVPCTDNSINEDCDGDGMVTFNCLNPGTYLIQIGSSAANSGEFSITATQTQNTAVANDLCTDAELIDITALCVPLEFMTTNIDACPENLQPGSFNLPCDFNSEETSWYIFTAPGAAGDMPTMDFRFTAYTGSGTPFMGIFNFGANCNTLTPVSTLCRQGLNTTFGNIGPFTPGNQYLIAISSFGDTGGNFTFEVKFNVGPPNDDPCAAVIPTDYDLSGQTPLFGTTLCAGSDSFFPDCPQNNQQNVVFFQVVVPANVRGVSINIRNNAVNGSSIPAGSPVVVGLWEETACNNNTYLEAACITLGDSHEFLCLEPGTYQIQVSTSSANAGDFTITAVFLEYSGICDQGADHDLCENALEISSNGVYCEPITFANQCNQEACPERFTFSADCPFESMPVVWYKFTAEDGVATVDLINLQSTPAQLFMAILEDNGCATPPTSITPCITANTLGTPVTPGTTYYIAVGINSPNMLGGNFRFSIVFNRLPENDDPIIDSPRPPIDLSGGGGHSGTTCCAIGFADNPNLDYPNLGCSAATHDNAVWYMYTVAGEKGLLVSVGPGGGGGNSITGNTTIEVYEGSATAPGGLLNPNSFDCSALPSRIKFGCLEPGTVIWIKVASRNADCGAFSITVEEPDICEYAETCADIGAAQTFMTAPTDVNCGAFILESISGCLDLACPEDNPTDCGIGDNPTVWFQVNTDANAVQLYTFVTTSGTWQPVWAIYGGDCNNLELLNGGTIAMPTPCSNGDSTPEVHNIGIPLDGDGNVIQTMYIAVSGVGVIDDPNFTLSAFTQAGCVSCIGDDCGQPLATFEVTDRSSDRPLDDLSFCQGEDVRICLEFFYDPSETGVDWFHGLIPDFGKGWDMDFFDPTNITVSPGGAVFLGPDDGECAPIITETMPYLCSYRDETGRLRLCHILCEACPCAAPLAQGSPLPDGWFWNSNGGAGCANNCNPSSRYGVPGSAGGLNISICMNLRTRVFDNLADCNANKSLQIKFVTTSDGVSGCWNDPIAECKLDIAQVGPLWELDCTPPVLVDFDDVEICDNGTLNSQFSTQDGSVTPIFIEPIPNPNVSGMNPYTFPGGFGTVVDMLDNLSTGIQLAQYIVWAQAPDNLCPGPRDTFTVTIYPSLAIQFDPLYVCDGFCIDVVPQVTGGTGNYVNYIWSTGETSTFINVCPTQTTTYFVTVTDNLGCVGSGSIEVEKKLPVSFDIVPGNVEICKDGVVDLIEIDISNVIANGFFGVSWDTPSGIDGTPIAGTTKYIIYDESSIVREEPYILCATVVDQFGCEETVCIEVKINPIPEVDLDFRTPYQCGDQTVNLTAEGYIPLDASNPFAWFYLYDCDNNLIESIYSGSGPDFINVPLESGLTEYCFRVVVIDDVSGCQNAAMYTFPAAIGTPMLVGPNQQICLGNSATISVTNPVNFTTITWTPGGQTGASISVSPTTTTQYTVVGVDNAGCSSQRSVTVTVNPLPTPNVTGSLSFCPGGNTTLTATGGTSYVWTNSGGTTVASTAQFGPTSTPGTYTVVVTNANGCTASATRTIIEDSDLDIEVPNITLCDNSPDTLDAGPGFLGYVWMDVSNNVIGTDRKIEVTGAGTYYISVTDGLCSGLDTVIVTNNNTPTLTIDTQTVCRQSSGQGPTTLNFVALQNGLTGQWFNTDLVPLTMPIDWSNVSFIGITADTFTFTFISDNAIAPCENITIPIQVIVERCACPLVTISNPQPLCNSLTGTNSTNLNNLRLGHSNAGVWTIVSGPAPPPVITGATLNASGAAAGTYRLRFTLTPPPSGNCPDSAEVNLIVNPTPFASAMDTVLCNAATGGGPTGIDLNTLLSANTATGGTWTQISGTTAGGTIPNISTIGLTPQVLVFEYTTNTATAPCTNVKTTTNVRVRDCSCPDVQLRPDTLCNGSMVLLDLEDPTKFSTDPAGIVGTWTITAPAMITNGRFINPFGITANSYTATFTVTGTLPPGCQRTFTKTIIIRNQTLVQGPGSPCSDQTGQGATTVNLFNLLRSGFTSGGTWTQVSPATPQLTIPANGIVEFSGQAIGTVFVFRYTVNASRPCTPVEVTVTVRDCNCPPLVVSDPGPLCNNGGVMFGMIDLSTLETNVGPGQWTATNVGGMNIPLTGKVLDVNGLPSGNYTVTYTLIPVPGGTCPRSISRTIRVENYVTAEVLDTSVCNSAAGGNSTFLNLSGLTVGNAPLNGVWLDPSGNPISNFLGVNFNGVAPGVYPYSLAINNVEPCEDVRRPFNIEVLDCSCPKFTLANPPSVCNNAGTFNLATLETEVPPGSWQVVNDATSVVVPVVGKVLTLTDLPAGRYRLTYVVINPQGSCPPQKFVFLDVFAPKNAGTATLATFCQGATDIVSLANQLTGQDAGGVWTSTQTVGFNANAGTFNLTGIAAGNYTFVYSFTNQAPCPDASATVTVRVNPLPVADAGADGNINCINRTTVIGGNSSEGATITYQWLLNGVTVGSTRTLTANTGGDYTLIVTNTETGCSRSDIVRVVQADDLPIFDIDSTNVRCFNENNGRIAIINERGGTPPYQYSFNGGATFGTAKTISNLAPGTYRVQMREANGCVNEKVVVITQPPGLAITLGPGVRINLGDTVNLSIAGQYDVDRITDIIWTANGVEFLRGISNHTITVKPTTDTNYEVTIIDANGCTTKALINISIIKVRILDIPNIIYTNGGQNSVFVVESKDIDIILKLRIYDRWGELVFSAENIDPVTEKSRFWNGTFKGVPVEQGVFVYIMDVRFKEGDVETRAGDVTVIK